MSTTTRKPTAIARLGLAFAVAAAAGAAAIPVTASARQAGVSSTSSSQTSWSDGADNVKVTTKGGKTEITVNGKTLPADASSFTDEKSGLTVTREGDHVIVMRKGEVVLRHSERLEAPGTPGVPNVWTRRAGPGSSEAPMIRGWRSAGPDEENVTIEIERPRVMVGVTMESIERDGRAVTVLQRVLEELPAARAGLSAGDVVVKVNGTEKSSPEDIRAAIRELDPGDTLSLTIERDGTAREVAVTVEAFEPGKFGTLGSWAPAPGTATGDPLFFFDSEQARAELENLRAEVSNLSSALTHLTESLAQASAVEAEKIAEKIGAVTRQLADSTNKLAAQASEMAGPHADRLQNLLRRQWGQLPNFRFENEDGTMRGFVVPAPAAPTPPGTPSNMDGRLERLNDRLDRLEALLQRLVDEQEHDESR